LIAFIMDALAPISAAARTWLPPSRSWFFLYGSLGGGNFEHNPSLGILVSLASIYSLVLMYMGLQKVKDVPKDKMVGYFVVTIIAAVVVFVVIGMIVGAVAFGSMSALGGFRSF